MMKKPKKVIKKEALVKVYKYGEYFRFTDSIQMSMGARGSIKKLNENEYLYTYYNRNIGHRVSEVRKYKHKAMTRADNAKRLERSVRKLGMLISNNFFGKNDELWVTLTYKKANMTDTKRVYNDFKIFMIKLRRRFGKLSYIYTIEPQDPNGHNSWHVHLLIKSTEKKNLTIENETMAKLWGKGFTKTKRLKQSDNVAGYVASYLCNVPVEDLNPDIKKDLNHASKHVVKSIRLQYYPMGIQLYRTSRDIKKPLEFNDNYYKTIKYFNLINKAPIFSNTSNLFINNNNYYINTEIYKTSSE